MEQAFTAEFITLDIPFFAIRPDLVVESDSDSDDVRVFDAARVNTVTKSELVKLKARMMEHLEILYG